MKEKSAISYPALRYRGGKWRIAPWVISHLPPHECYVEPFAGAASVLMRKPPSELECLNDLDGQVVAFWRVLRERPHEFIAQIIMTPFSRKELYLALEPVNGDLSPAAADLEKARRLWIKCYQGRGSTSRKSGWRFQPTNVWGKSRWRQHPPLMAARIHGLVDIAFRLRFVQIESADFSECIDRWDRPGTLFYVDPPYHDGREYSKNLYAHEMTELQHVIMAEQLHNIAGMAVVSGYPGLYDELYSDWCRVDRQASGERQKTTTECLWISTLAVEELARAEAQGDLLAGMAE